MLKVNKRILFSGESVIDEKTVCIFSGSIDSDDPQKMNVSQLQKDKEAYRAHREECRADYAAFEDSVFAAQAELLNASAPAE
jgi:hypothetical protein